MRSAAGEDSLAHRAGVGRGSTHARRARLFPLRLARDGKALALLRQPPRKRSECPASPRPRPVVLATRGEGWERTELPSHAPSRALRRSRGFPVACAHARAWDFRGGGTRRSKFSLKQSLLPSSLCLRNEGSPPSFCPEFHLHSLTYQPFPYKSPAELATHSSGTFYSAHTSTMALRRPGVKPHSSHPWHPRPCRLNLLLPSDYSSLVLDLP